VVAVTGKHSWFSSVFGPVEHSFAIACTEDQSVYDLQNLPDAEVINNRVSLPQAFYDAGCYLVDPWAQNMAELTRDEVDLQEWENILYVMGVYNRNQPKSLLSPPLPSDALTYFAQSTLKTQSCPVNLVCDVCSNRDAMNSKACQAWIPSQMLDPNKKYYYLFKRSGSGYRKKWGGWSDRFTGYDYFYQYILPSDAEAIKDAYSKFEEATANACEGGPALCPCAPYPDIWVEGKVEVVGIFDTVEELDPFRCDNHHYGPYYLICNMWNLESAPYPGYWPAIDGICGN